MTPQNDVYDWTKLNDGNDSTFGMTMNQNGAYMELDFGVGGKKTDRVRVTHITGVNWVTRGNGVTLYVMDDDRNIILQHTFSGIVRTSLTTFMDFAIPDI